MLMKLTPKEFEWWNWLQVAPSNDDKVANESKENEEKEPEADQKKLPQRKSKCKFKPLKFYYEDGPQISFSGPFGNGPEHKSTVCNLEKYGNTGLELKTVININIF